jgi:hypothetical protein
MKFRVKFPETCRKKNIMGVAGSSGGAREVGMQGEERYTMKH